VERPAQPPTPPPTPVRQPINLQPISLPAFERQAAPPPRRSGLLLPVLMSLLVVAGLAAIFIYQSGLGEEHAPPPVAQAAPSTSSPPPVAQAAPPTPLPTSPPPETKPSPVPDDTADNASAPEPRETVRIPPSPVRTSPVGTSPVPASPVSTGHAVHDVWVTTSPPGAKAVLDGDLDQACSTPCMLHGAAGVHHLTVSQVGYLNEYREVRIGDTAVDVPPISLRQPSSTLMVSTNPRGASVRINGQLIAQTTPAVITLKPGVYSVTVEKNGVTNRWDAVRLGDEVVHLSASLSQ
jgi:hypothetical protein